jgi:hypothetical protein
VVAVLAYAPDLMDRSKITAAAGREVVFVPSPPDLPGGARVSGVGVVVVDLSRPGVLEVLAEVASTGVRLIGFGSHVDRELLDAAGRAGCTEVMARSAFFHRLPELLAATRQ